MINRRGFISDSAKVVAAASVMPLYSFASKKENVATPKPGLLLSELVPADQQPEERR
ncbi:MAG: hypothetical protein K0M50_10010 [Prolixibacteraceae bacterium]|nr:hypothetical protein [Prolixibacteraceae bacterium]